MTGASTNPKKLTCMIDYVKVQPFFKWVHPTSIYGFSGCACVRVRKLVEAELTMTYKVKVVSLDE